MIVYPIYIGKNSVAAEYFKRQLDGAIAVAADHADAVRSISADALNKPLLFFYEKSNQKIDGQRIEYLKTQNNELWNYNINSKKIEPITAIKCMYNIKNINSIIERAFYKEEEDD